MSKREKDNPKYVTHAQCAKQVRVIKAEIKTIKNALVGEDMRGGLVKDVQVIKSATGVIKSVVVPIVTSVAAAVVTYLVLSSL